MKEQKIHNKKIVNIITKATNIFVWKGWQGIFNFISLIIAAVSLYIAYDAYYISDAAYKYSIESGRPQIAITGRGGLRAITNEHYCIQTSKPFLYKIPLLQIHTKNTGLRSLEDFTVMTTCIYPKSKTIFKGNALGSPNPYSSGNVWFTNFHPPVPVVDSTSFFLFLKLKWNDPLINKTDSMKLFYHCYFNSLNNLYDLNGIDNIQLKKIRDDIHNKEYEEFTSTPAILKVIQDSYITPKQ